MLTLCHLEKKQSRVSDGSIRTAMGMAESTPAKRTVKWKEELEVRTIEEFEYESDSEESVVSSDVPSSPVPSTPPSSPTYRDTISPTQLHSTKFTGLRRLTSSPHPHFNSEALQTGRPTNNKKRVVATLKTETVEDRSTKMPSTRFSTSSAVALDSAPSSLASPLSAPISATAALWRSTDTLNESRRSSSSSSSMGSRQHPQSEECSRSPSSSSLASSGVSRFAVSGTMQGASRLEAGLEGVCQLLNKTHSCQIRALHVQTSDPMLVDIVSNMQHHMRTEFATFAWPRALTERAQEILRRISVLTLVVEITIEYVPEKEGIFRRVSHQLKSVFSFFRRFR